MYRFFLWITTISLNLHTHVNCKKKNNGNNKKKNTHVWQCKRGKATSWDGSTSVDTRHHQKTKKKKHLWIVNRDVALIPKIWPETETETKTENRKKLFSLIL